MLMLSCPNPLAPPGIIESSQLEYHIIYTGSRLQRVRLLRAPGYNEQISLHQLPSIDCNDKKVRLQRADLLVIPLTTSKRKPLLTVSGDISHFLSTLSVIISNYHTWRVALCLLCPPFYLLTNPHTCSY